MAEEKDEKKNNEEGKGEFRSSFTSIPSKSKKVRNEPKRKSAEEKAPRPVPLRVNGKFAKRRVIVVGEDKPDLRLSSEAKAQFLTENHYYIASSVSEQKVNAFYRPEISFTGRTGEGKEAEASKNTSLKYDEALAAEEEKNEQRKAEIKKKQDEEERIAAFKAQEEKKQSEKEKRLYDLKISEPYDEVSAEAKAQFHYEKNIAIGQAEEAGDIVSFPSNKNVIHGFDKKEEAEDQKRTDSKYDEALAWEYRKNRREAKAPVRLSAEEKKPRPAPLRINGKFVSKAALQALEEKRIQEEQEARQKETEAANKKIQEAKEARIAELRESEPYDEVSAEAKAQFHYEKNIAIGQAEEAGDIVSLPSNKNVIHGVDKKEEAEDQKRTDSKYDEALAWEYRKNRREAKAPVRLSAEEKKPRPAPVRVNGKFVSKKFLAQEAKEKRIADNENRLKSLPLEYQASYRTYLKYALASEAEFDDPEDRVLNEEKQELTAQHITEELYASALADDKEQKEKLIKEKEIAKLKEEQAAENKKKDEVSYFVTDSLKDQQKKPSAEFLKDLAASRKQEKDEGKTIERELSEDDKVFVIPLTPYMRILPGYQADSPYNDDNSSLEREAKKK